MLLGLYIWVWQILRSCPNTNYDNWKIQMEALLEEKGFFHLSLVPWLVAGDKISANLSPVPPPGWIDWNGTVVLPKSSSVQFFALFAELRTGPRVWFRHLAELWSEPWFRSSSGPVQVWTYIFSHSKIFLLFALKTCNIIPALWLTT